MHSLQGKFIYYIALVCISSCTVFKPISNNSELAEADFRTKIIPGKTYLFELKSGQTQEVKVTEVDSVNLSGDLRLVGKGNQKWVPFTDSFSRLYTNVAEVQVQEKAPGRTVILVVIIGGVIVGIGAYYASQITYDFNF